MTEDISRGDQSCQLSSVNLEMGIVDNLISKPWKAASLSDPRNVVESRLGQSDGKRVLQGRSKGGLPRAGKDSGDDAVIRDRESKTTRIARCQVEQTFGCRIVCLRSRA